MGGKGSGTFVRSANDPANVDPSTNARVMAYTHDLMTLPPVDLSDAGAVRDRFCEYLDLCAAHGMCPLINGAAAALGMDRHAFSGIGRGDERYHHYRRKVTPEVIKVIERAYAMLSVVIEASLAEEKANPVKWIFLSKNGYGYQDASETVILSTRDETPQGLPPEQIAAKYAALAGRPLPELPE